jgi:hypothetical protein
MAITRSVIQAVCERMGNAPMQRVCNWARPVALITSQPGMSA